MKRIAAVIIFFLATVSLLPAQQLETNGFVEIDHISYFKNNNDKKINSRNQVILQTEFQASVNDKTAMYSAVEFRDDQSDPSRNRIYLDETYIDYYADNFDVRFGKQIIIWGKADGINPTDNITPWDYSDILDTDDERIGVISLKTDYYMGNWSLEGIVVPTFTASILPGSNSRWFPALPVRTPNPYYPGAGPPFLQTRYSFSNPQLPDENLQSAQLAGKLSSSLSGWDFSLSYYYGYDDLPSYHESQKLLADTLFIQLQPRYTLRKALGADFATTFGKWGVRGEGAYFFTADPHGTNPEIDDPYFQYVVGIDRTFSNIIGDHNLFVLVQWIQEISRFNTTYSADNLNHIFQKSISGKFEYEPGAFSKISLKGVYNLKTKDYYLHPGFSYQLSDGLDLNVTADILAGKAQSFFGGFRDNKRVQVRIKYSF